MLNISLSNIIKIKALPRIVTEFPIRGIKTRDILKSEIIISVNQAIKTSGHYSDPSRWV
jgi:hypothetical protein